MAGRMNWTKDRDRYRMRTQGTDCIKDDDPTIVRPILRPQYRRRRPSKEELRQQGAAALAQWRARHGQPS